MCLKHDLTIFLGEADLDKKAVELLESGEYCLVPDLIKSDNEYQLCVLSIVEVEKARSLKEKSKEYELQTMARHDSRDKEGGR